MKYKIKQGFITQKIKNEVTILNGEESVLYTLNETASIIFEKLKEGKSKKHIVSFILKNFSVTEAEVENDFEELIQDLKKKGIIY